MPLGEAMKRQGTEPCELPHGFHILYVMFMPFSLALVDVELHLSGVPAARRKSTAQKHQPCASLLIRLRPPPSAVLDEDEDEDSDSLVSSGES
jgi:hypothetical protein